MTAIDDRATTRRRLGLMLRVVRQAERRLLVWILTMLVLAAVAGAIQSVALKWLVDAAVGTTATTVVLAAAVGGLGAGLLGAAGRAMGDAQHVVSNEVGVLIDRNSLELTASIPGIEHLENPDFLDRLALVRGSGSSLMRAVFTVTSVASLTISLGASVWLLATVHPLLVLTPLCAVPTTVLVPRSERFVDRAKAVAAERQRASTMLHGLFLDPKAAMELRVFDASEAIDERADDLWRQVSDVQLGGAVRAAALASVGWLALTAGYVGALLLTAQLALDGRATVGDIVLVSQLALMVRGTVHQTAEAARRAASALRTADRFLWLEDLHRDAVAASTGRAASPDELRDGLRLEGVAFAYPGTDTPVLSGVDLELAAGETVAVVGDNGAGKTTLVKLLMGFYRPDTGRITVDGVDLTEISLDDWQARVGGTVQDFLRIETDVATSVGLGDHEALADRARIGTAIDHGGAAAVVDQLPDGLDTLLGTTYHEGRQLSGGQWQRLAISRGMMVERPLLLVLDEPSAALDPAAEQALFERYQATAAEIGRRGAITVLISHRFSSVRMADTIVVLDEGRVAEVGGHEELYAAGGRYAEMFRKQAEAYG